MKSLILFLAFFSITVATVSGQQPAPEDVEKYFATRDARITYHWVTRSMIEAQMAHRPVARVYAFIAGNMEGFALDVALGGPAGFAKGATKELLFDATKAMLGHPEKLCLDLANALMTEGLSEYRANRRLFKKWEKTGMLTEAERTAYLGRRLATAKIRAGKDLFADTLNYKYDNSEWEQVRGRLIGKLADLEGVSTEWDVMTAASKLSSVRSEYQKGLSTYDPYRRHLKRLRELGLAPDELPKLEHPAIAWAGVLAQDPDPSVVTDSKARRAVSASGLPWRVRDKNTGIEMLLVPAGTYMRGSPASDREASSAERPQHQVTISKPFYLGRYEVTQAEWRRVTGKSPSRFSGDRRPVERVSWNDIQPFLEATGLRLPTEAEWEYACRAGTTGPRYGDLDAIAWYDDNSDGRTHDVGGKAPNPWGFHDMIGNVREWCKDGYDSDAYSGCRGGVTDPVVSVGSSRVVRGGSWSYEARHCRSANRDWVGPTFRYGSFGFRVARAP